MNPLSFSAPNLMGAPQMTGVKAASASATNSDPLGLSTPQANTASPGAVKPEDVMGGDTLTIFKMVGSLMTQVFDIFKSTMQMISDLLAKGGGSSSSSGGGVTPASSSGGVSSMGVDDASGSSGASSKKGASSSGPVKGPSQAGKGGNLDQWIDEAIAILKKEGVPESKLNRADLKLIIQKESSGNPKAINNWDSNAKKGTPSKGLMQTIDPTFNSYKLKGYDNIWNPVHNIIAGARYAISRYGSISAVAAKKKGGRNEGY